MPELPEVETIARGVHERVRGDRIVEAIFGSHREPFKSPPARQAKGLAGRAILAVHRTGKHIVCELGPADSPVEAEPAAQWIVHLGMTGRLLVTTAGQPLAAHTHARLRLASGRELRFVDPRRFGRLDFLDLARVPAFSAAGVDPLTVTGEEFAQLFQSRHLAIKAALLNQSLLSGVGNIYADESLFHAGIRPRPAGGRLTKAQMEALRLALRGFCSTPSALADLPSPTTWTPTGCEASSNWSIASTCALGLPCRRCQRPIRRILLAGRGTHYCPNCQR